MLARPGQRVEEGTREAALGLWGSGSKEVGVGTRMSSSGSILSSCHAAPPRDSAFLLSLFSLLRLALAEARGSCG